MRQGCWWHDEAAPEASLGSDGQLRLPYHSSNAATLCVEKGEFWMRPLRIGWPPTSRPLEPPKVQNVELLGLKEKLIWIQVEQGLTVVMPEKKLSGYAIRLKID